MNRKIYANWKDFPMKDWRWPSFSPQELACRGTGRLMVNYAAMDKLQALRDKLKAPMIINSGYRSPAHNKAVGGVANSKHMEGIAFDVRMDNHNPDEYIAAALAVGFTGIGTYPRQNFVHIDDRGSRANWGAPFPKRKDTPKFPIEVPRPPEKVSQDGEAQSVLVSAGGLAVTTGGVFSSIGSLAPVTQIMVVAGIVVAGAAIAWLFRSRIKALTERVS